MISGNTQDGINLTGTSATGNTVAGNYVGLNAAGTAAIANGEVGVDIQAGATNNTMEARPRLHATFFLATRNTA